MKAFLLAAGLGTRLRPLTDDTPKCLLPIRGTPMLQIWFTLCRRHAIDDVLINVHLHGEVVRKFAEKNNNGLRVRIFKERVLLGSAGTILANRDWVRNEKCFWIFYADVLTTASLTQMLDFHNERDQIATIGVYEVPDPSRCGIVQVDHCGIVRNFVEKPKVPCGNLAFSGVMVASPALIEVIPNLIPADLGFDVLPRIVGRISAYQIPDFLIDTGTLETYQIAQEKWSGFPESPQI